MPFDEKWKKNELEKYLLHNPIWNWEGTPIQHLGHIHYISMVAVTNSNQEVGVCIGPNGFFKQPSLQDSHCSCIGVLKDMEQRVPLHSV